MIKEAIGLLVEGKSLSALEAAQVMEEIMGGQATPSQLGAFLTALRIKGETADELAGLARVMQSRACQVQTPGPLLDIVGTGGDGLNTFNISTTSAFIAAGAGIRVAKHGNRAATGKCGSADVLEKLGVKIDLSAEQVKSCIEEVGIGFMFAAGFHPAMKYAAGTRKEIGIRTVFNVLGPLTNPAHAQNLVIGVPGEELMGKIVTALVQLGVRHALVVHGLEGMDEISISGNSIYCEIKNGVLCNPGKQISPEHFGLKISSLNEIRGGNADENAETVRNILSGQKGAKRDIVVLNSAAALLAADRVENLEQGIVLAGKTIDEGAALARLDQLVEFTNRISEVRA